MSIKVTGTERHILNFKNVYDVDEDTTLELKGEFRSIGKEKSRIYFGLHCLKEDGKDIIGHDIYRTNESLLVTSYDSTNKKLILEKKPETWNNYNDSYSENNRKLIGIYFDGNIKHLPDYLINTPAYNNFTDNNIILNKEIPNEILNKIIPSTTRVMNHYSSNTYDYSAASYVCVPETWTEYKAEYKGFSEYGDLPGKFRLGTKKVSPFVLPNYGQNNYAVLEIRNIEVQLKDKCKYY